MDTIAELVGVSKTTVHRALADKADISPATRDRILQVAAEIGYRPNALARSLRRKQTATLGVIASALSGSFYPTIIEGIEGAAQEAEHTILLACSHDDPARERELVEVFLEKAVDGLLLMPADPEENCAYYNALAEAGVPLVFLDRYMPGVNVDSVATDNFLGGYMAGRFLGERGCRHVVIATPGSRQRRATSIVSRINGCNHALKEMGREPPLVLGPGRPDEPRLAYRAVREHLAAGGPVDGVFGVVESVAYMALDALREAGRRVPEEVAVVGFDDLDINPHQVVTTVRQPLHQIGAEGVRLLLRRLQEKDNPPPRQRISLEPTLIIREAPGDNSGR